MDFGAILKRAWNVTWKFKALWLFGFLAAFLSAGSDSTRAFSQFRDTFRYELGSGDVSSLNLSVPAMFAVLAVAMLFVLLLIVGSIILGNLANGAMIGMVDEVERTGTTGARSGWRIGWAKWLRLFAIGLVIGIPVFIVVVLSLVVVALPIILVAVGSGIGLAGLSNGGLGGAEAAIIVGIVLTVILGLLWILFLLVLGAAVKLLTEMAYRKCVLEGRGVFASIGEGYRLARRHLRDVGLTWLILWGISLGFNIIVFPIALLGLAIVAGPTALVWFSTQSVLATILVGVVLMLVVVAALSIVGGIYTVFESSVWTLTYREIRAREQVSAAPQTTV